MNCLATVSRYASLVKFSHTIFALPFALVGYVYALQSNGLPFEWPVLVKVLSAMVLARNTAMGFNRWADRRIDAQNPRTRGRAGPSGVRRAPPPPAGISHTLTTTIVDSRGFTAVMVSWMSKFNPFIMIASSLLLVVMSRGASEISTAFSLNQSFADILTGFILFFIIATEFFITYKVSLRKSSKKEA